MDDLRVGLVGAGWIAREHVETLERLGGTQIVAVCDVDPDRAKAVTGAATYDSWEDLLERETLDVLFICTPPLAHREPAVAALERGLNVFLEKPIARTLEDAAAIVSAAERSQAVCAVGYQWHATGVLDDLRSVLEGQEIGMLIGRSIGPTQGRPWFLDRAQGGGNILERGSHQIDLARTVAGEVESVQAAASEVQLAQGEGERGDIEDAAALVLRFANGGLGTLLVAWTRAGLPGHYTLDVLASEATLHLTLDPDFSLRGTSRGKAVEARSPQHPFERSVARFLEAAQAGDPSRVFCTPADAARTLAVAIACEEALSSGTTVTVPQTPAYQ
jgi:myo-inositol 2-dehydrogenase/D-chiro-inositol 1-dehydrogenase